jgi:hypothetical protein
MQNQIKESLSRCSASNYYEFILNQSETTAEAAYYLLKYRLAQALRIIYESHGYGLIEDFNDTIDDFFLYLYDDNPRSDAPPFAMLRSIKNKDAFFAWVLSTYRNFLLNKVKDAERERVNQTVAMIINREEERLITEEQMRQYLVNAIAYADQQLATMKRFVLYRLLLSFLDHRNAIPQEEMAQALKLNASTYRVYTKRQKDRFLRYISLQEEGGTLDLDVEHIAMSEELLIGFEHLYQALAKYYRLTLEQLPNADEINNLRMRYSHGKDVLMHEQQAAYGNKEFESIKDLYENIKGFLSR